jgi:hypothetical protein
MLLGVKFEEPIAAFAYFDCNNKPIPVRLAIQDDA